MENAKVVMFFPQYVYASVDITGNISTDGTAEQIVCGMDNVEYLDEMRELVDKINFANYGRKTVRTTYSLSQSYDYDDLRDMTTKYDNKYGTRWLFVKNLSGRKLEIRGADGATYVLPHRKLGVLYCGMPSGSFPDRFVEITDGANVVAA